MRAWVGTSGFAFPAWKGPFYPEKLPAARMLSHYGSVLRAVEINATFYRLPTEKTLATWASEVPERFRFSLKASRYLSHYLGLDEAGKAAAKFFGLAEKLGHRLGVVLVQLAPHAKKDVGALDAFLAELPTTTRVALELRDPSWDDDEVRGVLRDRGVALVASETDPKPAKKGAKAAAPPPAPAETPLHRTAPFAYLRLRKEQYAPADLEAWADRLAASGHEDAFVFFKHEDDGEGPRLAQALVTLLRARGVDA
jgi:uncharacterized protein YecE (DUF72 family)